MTPSLIILDKSSDISYLASEIKHSQSKIISFDFMTHESLLHLGLKHEKVEDYFEIGDYESIDHLAIETSLSWYKQKEISSYLQFEDLNLGWLMENELSLYFLNVLKNFLALIRVLDKEKPIHVMTSDFIASMIKEIDKNNKITIQICETKKKLPKELDCVSFPISMGKTQFTLWIPKKDFLRKVKQLTHKHGALLIFDEVVTGFRFAIGGAQQYLKIEADLVAFGKGIANGMPLGAITGKSKYMEKFNDIFYSTTYGGETLSLAAASAVIDEIQTKPVTKHLWKLGEYFTSEFNKITENLDVNVNLSNEKLFQKTGIKMIGIEEGLKSMKNSKQF